MEFESVPFRLRVRDCRLGAGISNDGGAGCLLARLHSGAEYVVIGAIVVAELELINVQRKILGANLMECTNSAALHDRTARSLTNMIEGFWSSHIRLCYDAAMWIVSLNLAVCLEFIRTQHAIARRTRLAHEGANGFGACVRDHSRNNVVFALHRADDNRFASSAAAAHIAATAGPFVLVLHLSTDASFIDFNLADKVFERDVAERNANLAARQPRGFVGTETHAAHCLERADAFLADRLQSLARAS
jgi:hypothetical protein